MRSPVAEAYVSSARQTLAGGLHKIEHCVKQLNEEQVWWRPRAGEAGAEMNSIANLLLHLSGNVRQWIISGVGGAEDRRNRPAEFADRSRRPASEVMGLLRGTLAEADGVLAGLTDEEMLRPRRIQGFDTNGLDATFHAIYHFRGHVQEIIHMTRVQLGAKYVYDFVPKGAEQVAVHSA